MVPIIAAVALLFGRVEAGQSDASRSTSRFILAFGGWAVRPRGLRREDWFGYEALIVGREQQPSPA